MDKAFISKGTRPHRFYNPFILPALPVHLLGQIKLRTRFSVSQPCVWSSCLIFLFKDKMFSRAYISGHLFLWPWSDNLFKKKKRTQKSCFSVNWDLSTSVGIFFYIMQPMSLSNRSAVRALPTAIRGHSSHMCQFLFAIPIPWGQGLSGCPSPTGPMCCSGCCVCLCLVMIKVNTRLKDSLWLPCVAGRFKSVAPLTQTKSNHVWSNYRYLDMPHLRQRENPAVIIKHS